MLVNIAINFLIPWHFGEISWLADQVLSFEEEPVTR